MVGPFDCRLGGPGPNPGQGHLVVSMGKTLYLQVKVKIFLKGRFMAE